ncbi:hypothetical protein HAX54_033049 [Datura stramonium]|uniref:Probable purine permease n=1 Tax=Datura stramonium TaxID=4076 RepID=A0ABS8SD19_DATST|nr:hypothetical protein [Datura stramonium]
MTTPLRLKRGTFVKEKIVSRQNARLRYGWSHRFYRFIHEPKQFCRFSHEPQQPTSEFLTVAKAAGFAHVVAQRVRLILPKADWGRSRKNEETYPTNFEHNYVCKRQLWRGPLISRLYFIHGGQRIWLSSWLQTVACPLILTLLAFAYFQRRKIEGPAAKILFITGVGIIAGLDGYLISWGPAKLPVSTSSLINATQLAFTALFAVLLMKQKLTAYSKCSVVRLIAGAATLVLRSNGDRPAGESGKEYMLGFVMTVMGAVCFGLMLPLIELIYVKAKQAITYTTVLEIQMIIGISATAFCNRWNDY